MSFWHWVIVLAVVLLLFGTKKLPSVGGDIAAAIKNFRKGLQGEETPPPSQLNADPPATPASGSDNKRENPP